MQRVLNNNPQRLRCLAEFRFELRRFLHFSESCAAEAGLEAQQHQLLLQIAGAAAETETTITFAAERLGLRHHSVVELSKRCQEAGLIDREQDVKDRRRVQLRLTSKGHRLLRVLSEAHERELHELAPKLIRALSVICASGQNRSSEDRTAAAS